MAVLNRLIPLLALLIIVAGCSLFNQYGWAAMAFMVIGLGLLLGLRIAIARRTRRP